MSDDEVPSDTLRDAQSASVEGTAGLVDEGLADLGGGLRAAGLAVPRVMLVEDDFILRAHLAELLMMEGYVVTCAADGAEALRRLKTEPPPSIILVDILMPRLNGIAFRKLQLETPGLRDILTVALTSLVDIDDTADLRFADLIHKPVNLDHLLESLARLCPRA
jgi:two-component system, chemotaxis family, chemotaxis protein CheY